ncbi:Putative ribonuclease H protein At1g65750 [Linum grandiflorum]
MVNWNKVKTPISRGGLGILDICCLNSALLSKWLWRFGAEQDSWWRNLINQKYGSDRGSEWRSLGTLDGIGWSVWYWISKESAGFWDIAYIDPGGGERVRFWHDIWLPGKHLVRDFPRVASAALNTNTFVSDLLVDNRDDRHIPLTVDLRGGAREELLRFLGLLHSLPMLQSGPPRLVWNADRRHGFSVRSYKDVLILDRFQGDALFPSKAIWNSMVPTKISCFTWLASADSVATIDNLRRRGMIVPNRCVLCCRSEESVSHILLHCRYTVKVWNWFKAGFGIFGPWPSCVQQLLLEWRDGLPVSFHKKFKPLIPQALMWFVWLERNNRIFRETSCSELNLAWKIAFNTSRWLMANKEITTEECSSWLNSIFHPP